MFPSTVRLRRGHIVDEAVAAKADDGDEARILAGGQSLLPMMKIRLASPAKLIDINRIPGLDTIERDERSPPGRRARAPRRRRGVRPDVRRGRGGRPVDLRSARAQPRHAVRVRRALRSGGRLELRAARDRRRRHRPRPDGRAHDPDRRLRRRACSPTRSPTTRWSPRSASPCRRAGPAGTYLKLERKVGDYATVGVAAHLELADDGTISRGRRRRSRRWVRSTSRSPRPRRRSSAARRATSSSPRPASSRRARRTRATTCGAPPPGSARSCAPTPAGRWPPPLDAGRSRTEGGADGDHVTVNGTEHTDDVEPRVLLVHHLREDLGLTGTHIGCDTSSCGACTVLLDGRPVKSCTMLAVQADGRAVTTVEGLKTNGAARPDPAGVQGGARPAVRVLHAGDDARRQGAHRDERPPRPTTTCAGRSPGTSAAAPAT